MGWYPPRTGSPSILVKLGDQRHLSGGSWPGLCVGDTSASGEFGLDHFYGKHMQVMINKIVSGWDCQQTAGESALGYHEGS